MRIYLASPGSQLHAECMAGMHVLESFADGAHDRWMVRYRATFASLMLDSGAYTEMTTGKPVDLGAYIAFALEHGRAYETIVNLDVISGAVTERVDAGKRNLQRMRDAGLDPMPVFHQGEPWSVLDELAACGHVGLGLQRPMKHVDRFLGAVFERLPTTCKVHGFALANERYTGRYPFASVDSATWIHELNAAQAGRQQALEVLKFLTTGELLGLVVKKYQRLPTATAWAGLETLELFEEDT